MRGVFLIGVLLSLLIGGLVAIRRPAVAPRSKTQPLDEMQAAELAAAGSVKDAAATAASLRAQVERDIRTQKATEQEALQAGAE